MLCQTIELLNHHCIRGGRGEQRSRGDWGATYVWMPTQKDRHLELCIARHAAPVHDVRPRERFFAVLRAFSVLRALRAKQFVAALIDRITHPASSGSPSRD